MDERRIALWHSLLPHDVRVIELPSADGADDVLRALDAGLALVTGDPDVDALLAGEAPSQRLAAGLPQGRDFEPQFLSLMVAENCNLGCDYCIASVNMESSRQSASTRMSWERARSALDWFAVQPARERVINFTGGEPLLNWPTIKQALNYISSVPALSSASLSINTNATLVTTEIATTLAARRVAIATSLDGTPDASDLIRVTRRGRFGASRAILAGWDLLQAANCDLTGFMATFDQRNYEALNATVVDFALERGFSWVRVDCDVIHLNGVSASETADRIWEIFVYGEERGVQVEGFWSTAADNLLNPGPAQPAFCGAVGGKTITVHPNGRLSACGFSESDHGSVTATTVDLNIPRYRDLVDAYSPGARPSCRGCDLEGSCAGGCNIAREQADRDRSQEAIDWNCELYRSLTRRLIARAAA